MLQTETQKRVRLRCLTAGHRSSSGISSGAKWQKKKISANQAVLHDWVTSAAIKRRWRYFRVHASSFMPLSTLQVSEVKRKYYQSAFCMFVRYAALSIPECFDPYVRSLFALHTGGRQQQISSLAIGYTNTRAHRFRSRLRELRKTYVGSRSCYLSFLLRDGPA